MVNHKTGNKAAPSAKKALGRAARAQSASTAAEKKTVAARPAALRPAARASDTQAKAIPTRAAQVRAARVKAAPTKAAPAKAAPAKAAPAKAAPAKAMPTRANSVKATSAKITPKPSPAAARQPAPLARGAVASRDDDARRRIQVLEQERAELQNISDQMRAELGSALAEADRLREHLREQMRDLETTQRRQAATEPGPASPVGFDPAADLDEEISAVPDDDLDETAGFFDRMDEIRARRNELDRERNDRELEQSDQPFWMICPKCGDLMEESEGENVKLERCENCGGLYLDRGEVDLILSLCVGPDAYRRLHNIMKF